MRGALGRIVFSLIIAPLFAGCITSPTPDLEADKPLDLTQVLAPGALVEATPEGARVLWIGPLRLEAGFLVTIPSGVNRVDAAYTRPALPNGQLPAATILLSNAATKHVRCQPDATDAWMMPKRGTARCSGLTVVDPLPVTWRASPAELANGAQLELRLSTEPLDGQAAHIKLESLSMPRFGELPTQVHKVPSSLDGARLHLEVTRPDTSEPVPTILVSSPYLYYAHKAGVRAENSTIANWVPRGYAIVAADVRGFASSEGCVEVWGRKEQQDQVDLVEWIAKQPWSNGKVGMYGVSYDGTTPVEAASRAAPHLTTIITIAPVINAYEDWHFGGVPNGENTGSPTSYQSQDTQAGLNRQDYLDAVQQASRGFCDPTLLVRANDPRAVYDDFYRERDFKKMAANVRASVFYTQGFYDTNVKSQMIPGWFNELNVPKKALFGDWVHQLPPRADQELLFHAWFDQWLLGRDTGILDTPVVEVRTNEDTIRTDDAWPPRTGQERRLGLDFGSMKIALDAAGAGQARYHAAPSPLSGVLAGHVPAKLRLVTEPLPERLYLAGQSTLDLRATLQGAENTFVYAALYDLAPDGKSRLVTFGMLNAALRNGYEKYEPVPAGQPITLRLPFLVTENVVPAGHKLALEIRAVDMSDWRGPGPGNPGYHGSEPGTVTLEGASSDLVLQTLSDPGDRPLPRSSGPSVHPAS